MASQPVSRRLAIAILPLRDKQFHRGHFAEMHPDRVVSSLCEFLCPGFGQSFFVFRCILFRLFVGCSPFLEPSLFGIDHVNAHLAELPQNFDLLGCRQRAKRGAIRQPFLAVRASSLTVAFARSSSGLWRSSFLCHLALLRGHLDHA